MSCRLQKVDLFLVLFMLKLKNQVEMIAFRFQRRKEDDARRLQIMKAEKSLQMLQTQMQQLQREITYSTKYSDCQYEYR